MGNNNSSVGGASFDADEIRRLEKRFRKLDTNGSGSLTPDGWLLDQSLIHDRLIDSKHASGSLTREYINFTCEIISSLLVRALHSLGGGV